MLEYIKITEFGISIIVFLIQLFNRIKCIEYE